MIRLNKFLSECGIDSRRNCDKIIADGKVMVNNQIVTSLGTVINEKSDIVMYDGKVLQPMSTKVYLKMNKPKGYLCLHSDPYNRKTVYSLLNTTERLFAVGRLYYDTEGLLIFTNDGDLANKLAHPRNEVKKVYIARIEGTIKESELAVMRAGVVIDGEKLPSWKVEFVHALKGQTKLKITLKEGLNHQIIKMFWL